MGVGLWVERLRQNAELGRRLREQAMVLTPAELAMDILIWRARMFDGRADLPEQLRCATAIVAYRGELVSRMKRGEA